MDNLKRPVSFKQIDSTINNFPKQKAPGPDRFAGKFYEKFKEEIILVIYNFSQKTETEEMFPNSSYEANSTT